MSPSAPDPRFMAALKLRRQGDPDAARAALEQILEQDPEHADALEVLGMLLAEQGELDRAIEVTRRLAELTPDSIMAHANLSRFFMLKGDKATAEEWQGKARVLGWKEEVGRKAKGGGGPGGLGDGVDPEQLQRQEEAVAQRPDDVLARVSLASSYRKLGMLAKAIAQLRKARQLDGNLSTVYLDLGACLELAGMRDQATEVYREGLPVAERRGDLMPRNQMASRLAALEQNA